VAGDEQRVLVSGKRKRALLIVLPTVSLTDPKRTDDGRSCQLSAKKMTFARETATSTFCGRYSMDILMLTETEVQRLLDPDALLDALAEGFRAQSSGLVDAPKRIGVSVPNTGLVLAMPAYQQGREVTV
jgi:hypothetical protein